ncbi:MAG: DUF1932 domain-containing protein [Streptosporangiales bacterium]|nr:DUF1932 domain-containing protein [Streptosporangiales bacterium]
MGAAVAREVRAGRVLWCPAGRSAETAKRAEGLEPVEDLGALLDAAEIVLSVCPPAAAEDVAKQVAAHRFGGAYVEANAISPRRTEQISELLGNGGTRVVDGGIIGPPPTPAATARLYLSGPAGETAEVAGLFEGSNLEPVVLGERIGQASALKMAFGGFNKAGRALAAVAHALADRHDVQEHLLAEARRSHRSALAEPGTLPGAAASAWRWAPEMLEVAATLRAEGLPDDFANAAAQVMERWAGDKDDFGIDVATVLAHLAAEPGG